MSKSTVRVQNLGKRTSDISKQYDESIGPSIEVFSRARLPQNRQILQRYRGIRSASHNMSLSDAAKLIAKELIEVWDLTRIPYKTTNATEKSIQRFIQSWNKKKADERVSSKEQEKLNCLFDLRPANLLTDEALKIYLKKHSCVIWAEEWTFFLGQLSHPQTSSITPTTDQVQERIDKEKAKRAASRDLFNLNNSIDTTGASSSKRLSANQKILLQDELIINNQRKRHQQHYVDPKTDDETGESANDDDWMPSTWEKHKIKKRDISLNIPANKIPSLLSNVSTISKVSIRQELKMTATLLKAGGGDINDASQSVSRVYRQRKAAVTEKAKEIRCDLKKLTEKFVVVHFDGKIIQLMSGKTEDRLAICISIPNENSGRFLASPKIANGTGKNMADAVLKTLDEADLRTQVQAVVFDTTASNSGTWKGSVRLLEQTLKRAFLWLACRHHIAELHIQHANKEIRGPSKGPDDPLFKRFKDRFEFLDLDSRSAWKWPNRGWRKDKANEVLLWADKRMERGTWVHEDYRELLELVVIYLGGVVKRIRKMSPIPIDVRIRKPGAVHHARFMASSLYILKIAMYRHQNDFGLTTQEKNEIEVLAEFIALIYAPYFLQSPLAIDAPRLDRDLFRDLESYQQCFRTNSLQHRLVTAARESVLRHLWYLTEENVIFALFDTGLAHQERKEMADILVGTPRPVNFDTGKPRFPIEKIGHEQHLKHFVGERSWLFFERLNADGEWLTKPVEEWISDGEYTILREILGDLKVVNDPAERCVKDIQEYCNLTMDPSYKEDILVVATDQRGIFQDLRKDSLKNL